jgi:hypothetical protein
MSCHTENASWKWCYYITFRVPVCVCDDVKTKGYEVTAVIVLLVAAGVVWASNKGGAVVDVQLGGMISAMVGMLIGLWHTLRAKNKATG